MEENASILFRFLRILATFPCEFNRNRDKMGLKDIPVKCSECVRVFYKVTESMKQNLPCFVAGYSPDQ